MSQRAVFIKVGGNVHEEVWTHIPDHEDFIQICKDFGLTESNRDKWGNSVTVDYEWIEIGSGEGGADTFVSDEVLLHLYGHPDFSTILQNMGYEVEYVQSGYDLVTMDDLVE